MINNIKDIERVLDDIDKIPIEDLDEAIKEVDKELRKEKE